jgi:hypothetical protein
MTKAAELAKMGEVLTNSQIGGRRNIVINGAMQVAQRSTNATGIGASSVYPSLDRFLFGREDGSQSARFTVSQENVSSGDEPFTTDGHNKMMKVDITTASGGISSGQAHYISQRFEGQDVFHLGYGTSSAKTVTLSFWIKTDTKTGVMGVSLFHGGSRSHVKEISLTTSWQKFELTYIGDTGDTFANDNTSEYQISFALSAGSNFQVTANQWADGFDLTTSNQVDFTDNTSNNIYLTGLQLEVGEQATPFEHRSFGEELLLCKRYTEVFRWDDTTNALMVMGYWTSTTTSEHVLYSQVEMRAVPSFSFSNATDFDVLEPQTAFRDTTGIATNERSRFSVKFTATSATAGFGDGRRAALLRADTTDAFMMFDAEL